MHLSSLRVVNGLLADAASGEASTNIPELNTATPIESALGPITLAEGDVIVRFVRNSGADAIAFASIQYSSKR